MSLYVNANFWQTGHLEDGQRHFTFTKSFVTFYTPKHRLECCHCLSVFRGTRVPWALKQHAYNYHQGNSLKQEAVPHTDQLHCYSAGKTSYWTELFWCEAGVRPTEHSCRLQPRPRPRPRPRASLLPSLYQLTFPIVTGRRLLQNAIPPEENVQWTRLTFHRGSEAVLYRRLQKKVSQLASRK